MTAIAAAIAEGVLGGRLWMYANYHCNLECTYCLTESGPNVSRRQLDPDWMVARAAEARDLGFTSIGITGGEPFMVASMPSTVARIADILPTIVLSNGSLFHGPRLEKIVAALTGKDVHIQVSLDAPDALTNDTKRGEDNFADVCSAIPRLVQHGLKVRIATTTEDLDDAGKDRLCELHRSWGVPDEDHVVRPIVSRGRAALDGIGVPAGMKDLPAELCLTADGAFWSAFGPTVRNGAVDTDLLISRVTSPVEFPANLMLRLAAGRPPGTDATLGIR